MKKIFFIILLCSSFTFAADLEVIDENIFGVSVQYSLLDLIVPSKYGISGHRNYNGHMFEAEYIRGTMSVPLIIADIGSVTNQRFTVRQRRFVKTRNFHWYYGATYFLFDAKLGSDLLNTVTPGSSVADVDLAKHRALGFELGIGHRWHFNSDFTFGVDWFSWTQPLFTLENDIPFLKASNSKSTKDKVEKALNIVGYIPRFSILKVHLGYVF